MHKHMSSVVGCDVRGGAEGIVTHSAMAMVSDNRVHGTTLRGIAMTEMSMGHVEENNVSGALGVGIFCGDRSECEIARNVVTGTRPDHDGDASREGVGIESHFDSVARVEDNVLVGNAVPMGAYADARIEHE
jgi:nitrous oxidase accessory protein NosD